MNTVENIEQKPILIALNGMPGSGKSTVQEILERRLNIKMVDDGHILREHCRELFDLSYDDVTTQSGKKRFTEICGKSWENRKILGEYGAALEATFGSGVIPSCNIRAVLSNWNVDRFNFQGYSFGSVRRDQGKIYRNHGGIVIEVIRPQVEQSGNVWDNYDQRWVNLTFTNDAENLTGLEHDVVKFFTDFVL